MNVAPLPHPPGTILLTQEALRKYTMSVVDALAGRTYTDITLAGSLAFTEAPTLTIAAGVIDLRRTEGPNVASVGAVAVDTEAAAATDNLDTILGGRDGELIFLRAFHADRTVVVQNGTGNIDVTADVILDTNTGVLPLVYNGVLAKWLALVVPGGVIASQAASGSVTLTGAEQDIPGTTITLENSGVYLVSAVFDFNVQGDNGNDMQGRLSVAGVSQSGEALLRGVAISYTLGAGESVSLDTNVRATVTQTWLITTATDNVDIKLVVLKSGGGGSSQVMASSTRIIVIGRPTLSIAGGTPISHNSLADVTPDQHHAQAHAIDGADHTGVLADAQIPAAIARDTEVATAVSDHAALVTGIHGVGASTVESVAGSQAKVDTHAGLADPHTGYRLEGADHSHQSTGLQAGQLDHGLALTGLTDDDHTQYLKEEASGGVASEVPDHAHSGVAEAGGPLLAANTHASASADTHHAQAHGAADHTNRTRNLWLPAAAFYLLAGTPVLAGVHGARGSAWLLDSATTEAVGAEIAVPEDWASGTVAVKIHYSMALANASKVIVWELQSDSFANGDSMAAGASIVSSTNNAPANADTLKIIDTSGSQTITVAAGELMQIRIGRQGGSGSDNAAGDMQFLGAELEYTADM